MRATSLALAADKELVLESLLDLDQHSEGLGLFRRPIPPILAFDLCQSKLHDTRAGL